MYAFLIAGESVLVRRVGDLDAGVRRPGPDADQAPGGDAAAEASQEEFQPVPDETARQRRVVRKRKRRSLDQTSDDTDAGWGEHTDQSAHDRWLQEQRPPHWGHD